MTTEAPSIVIVAGESSGDLYGVHLATGLKSLLPGADIRGVGSRRMREAGVNLLCDSSDWSAIGITEALRVVPKLLGARREIRANLKADPPHLLVLIDFGAFNTRLMGRSDVPAIPTLYFIPPGSWRRGQDYSRLNGIADRIVTPFPWSAEDLRQQGFSADFFGHPLLDIVRPTLTRAEFCDRHGLDVGRPIVGLLPGSRRHEIAHNLPALVLAASELTRKHADLQFVIPLSPSLDPASIAEELNQVSGVTASLCGARPHRSGRQNQRFGLRRSIRMLGSGEPNDSRRPVAITLVPGMACDVLAHSRAAVISSGTATVEAMILGCPMVIIYRGSRLMTLEYKLLGKGIRFIGMPNIIANREICPELIAEQATPGRICELLMELLSDTPERIRMLGALAEAKRILGEPGAIEKTCRLMVEMLGRNTEDTRAYDVEAKTDQA